MTDIIPHRKVIVDSGLAKDIISTSSCLLDGNETHTGNDSLKIVMWNWYIMN